MKTTTLLIILAASLAPFSLIAQPQETGPALDLTWQDNSTNETGFAIERSLDGVSWEEVARVGKDVEAFTDLEIGYGVLYLYRVRAFNEFGFSGYSNESPGMAEDMRPDGVPENLFIVFRAPNGGVYQVTFDGDGKPSLVELSR